MAKNHDAHTTPYEIVRLATSNTSDQAYEDGLKDSMGFPVLFDQGDLQLHLWEWPFAFIFNVT